MVNESVKGLGGGRRRGQELDWLHQSHGRSVVVAPTRRLGHDNKLVLGCSSNQSLDWVAATATATITGSHKGPPHHHHRRRIEVVGVSRVVHRVRTGVVVVRSLLLDLVLDLVLNRAVVFVVVEVGAGGSELALLVGSGAGGLGRLGDLGSLGSLGSLGGLGGLGGAGTRARGTASGASDSVRLQETLVPLGTVRVLSV